jgi:hypothetical protein
MVCMTDFATAVLRNFVIKLLAVVFTWVGVHFIAIPEADKAAITNWAVLAVAAGLMFVYTVVIHWLETRAGNGTFAVACRAVARILMLGIKARPTYLRPAPEPQPAPVVTPIHQVGPDGKPLQ